MTRREYIKELLSHVRSIGSLPGELEKSLPSPEEGSKGQEAAVIFLQAGIAMEPGMQGSKASLRISRHESMPCSILLRIA